ncbi:MAG: hypothetical protein M1135_03550 [Candidatus Omnitrophica bacterium]|nr:hypothetical protein [Candidatus Omnitrophota bacterium]
MKMLSGNTIVKFLTINAFCLLFIISAYGKNFSIVLSSKKSCYMEEETISLNVTIKNISPTSKQLKFNYLQPITDNALFVPSDFKLKIFKKDIHRFTNWLPPEPKPGIKLIYLKPGSSINFNLPFPWYHYPINLPVKFHLKIDYKNNYSNTILLKIIPTPGKKGKKNILVNGNFSQGKNFPFGWMLDNKNVSWNSQKHLVRFSLDKNTAENQGVWLNSIFYPVQSPSSWALSIKAKTTGPQLIVFVEGWGIVDGERRLIERNDCFFNTQANQWKTYTSRAIFENPDVKWLRIKLFAYLTAGTVLFKKVDLQQKNNLS